MNTKLNIGLKIISRECPEWGTWIVIGYSHDNIYIIRGNSGETTLSQQEFNRFWDVI